MAMAGFARNDLDITVQENELRIRGNLKTEDDSERTWLHRGIARRALSGRSSWLTTWKWKRLG